MNSEDELQDLLEATRAECTRLREENSKLRELLKLHESVLPKPPPAVAAGAFVKNHSPTEVKVRLFRKLFRGREDVYAIRWEGRNGKKGYSPACAREWGFGRGINKHNEGAANRRFLPLTDQVIFDHLAGKHVVGVYPLLQDETCWFLAADFDKSTWQEDAAAFLATCREWGVPAALERSRSGKGGHIWIFFEYQVSATLARKLGSAILTRTMERRHQVGLDSYDRLFPNQDTMPKGGFGNLIALPLQQEPRSQGNSVFLDEHMEQYLDQWAFLSSRNTMQFGAMEAIVRDAERAGKIIGVRLSLTSDEFEDQPWTLPPSKRIKEPPITESLPQRVRVIRGNLIYLEKAGMPSAMLNRLLRLAAFQNPEFYKAQAMRLSTFDKPRIIRCGTEFPNHIGLPRGCLAEVTELLKKLGVELEIKDERLEGEPICVEFYGELYPRQEQAANAILAHDDGVLSATTAFGKTVVAAHLIAARKANTLVLVHRRQLMDQWHERLSVFLNLPKKSIGQIGGGKNRRTGVIDIAIIQSLNSKGEVADLVAGYGHVIVDECHHLSAFSFEQVLREVKARYVLGLTATPVRKDGHHPIIFMQCGPVRFHVQAKEQAISRPFNHIVIPRYTNFRISPENTKPEIHELYAALIADKHRNNLIFSDLISALRNGRSPLLLTERKEHLNEFAERLKGVVKHVVILKGGMGARQRKELVATLAAIPENEARVLIGTGRYIGEGFDDARLDTLFLVMPISWRGTLQQYVGRLHRLHAAKHEVQVYDYVDGWIPMFNTMFTKRLKGYEAIGYEIRDENQVFELAQDSSVMCDQYSKTEVPIV